MAYDNIINPYANIDWSTVDYVPSCTHEHGRGQTQVNRFINGGLRHLALSNYYPSAPYYPLGDYVTIPDGIIGSPNAEHHSISPYPNFHCNSLGSFFSSGSPSGETPVGMNGLGWKLTFKMILAQLQYEDGGGVTINHPHWTRDSNGIGRPTNQEICEMLDYDDRVLGIEFFNGSSELNYQNGWDLDTWDAILKTGRRCWGFCVADHGENNDNWIGRNILLCSEFTEHECLKAYRDGRFYGSIYNTSLKFTSILFNEGTLSVSAPGANYINLVIDGVYNRVSANNTSVNIPNGSTYVRVEAHNGENSIYSQPIIINPKTHSKDSTAKKMLILS